MGKRGSADHQRWQHRQDNRGKERCFGRKIMAGFIVKISATDVAKRRLGKMRSAAAATIQRDALVVVIRYRKFRFNFRFHVSFWLNVVSFEMRFASSLDSKVFRDAAPIAMPVPRLKTK